MRKLALVIAFASAGALAGEVGAPNLQETEAELALATQETGASTSWAIEPIEAMATAHQVQKLNESLEQLNEQISRELEVKMTDKLERSLPPSY